MSAADRRRGPPAPASILLWVLSAGCCLTAALHALRNPATLALNTQPLIRSATILPTPLVAAAPRPREHPLFTPPSLSGLRTPAAPPAVPTSTAVAVPFGLLPAAAVAAALGAVVGLWASGRSYRPPSPPSHEPVALLALSGAHNPPPRRKWAPPFSIRPAVAPEHEAEAQVRHGRLTLLRAAWPGLLPPAAPDALAPLVFGSIFGLGAPEVAVIVITAGLVLGPKKLAELARDAGKVTGQLKDVTQEFQQAVQEGMREVKDAKPDLNQPVTPKSDVPRSSASPTPESAKAPVAADPMKTETSKPEEGKPKADPSSLPPLSG